VKPLKGRLPPPRALGLAPPASLQARAACGPRASARFRAPPPPLPPPLPHADARAHAPPRACAPQDAQLRLVCNPLRFAANYALLAVAASALSALARPLDLLFTAALALALFAGGSQRLFDAAWPHLHRSAIFQVMGQPFLVDGALLQVLHTRVLRAPPV